MTTSFKALPAALAISMLASAASAATLYVANNGVDSRTCGSQTSPCRSISRAIDLAASGDTIEVGPGLYGDIDHDGEFDFPGDEEPQIGNCDSLLVVDKPLTIVSRAGASQTILGARWRDERLEFCALVRIKASSVVFGRRNHGFTLTSSNGTDLIDDHTQPQSATGILVDAAAAEVTISGNFFVFDLAGVEVFGPDATVSDNAFQSNERGINAYGERAKIAGNAIDSGLIGVSVAGGKAEVSGNMVSANRLVGIFLSGGDGHIVAGNAIHGNGVGIQAEMQDNVAIHGNNIFGNNSPFGPFGLTNAGLIYDGSADIDATNNYWGTPFPGPDPGDIVYGLGGGSVETIPASATPFAIAIAPLK